MTPVFRSPNSTAQRQPIHIDAGLSERRSAISHGLEPLLAALAFAVIVTCSRPGVQKVTDAAEQKASVPSTGSAQTTTTRAGRGAPSVARAPAAESAVPPNDKRVELRQPQGLTQWRVAFQQLALGQRKESVRVLWFGDSHTAADYFPNAIRKQLTTQVPLGGPGYIGLGIPGYRHGMAKVWSEGNIEISPHPPARRGREEDGVFGLGGMRATLRDATAFLTAKAVVASAAVLKCELTYRLASDSDALRVTAVDQRFELTSSAKSPMSGGLGQLRFSVKGDTTVEIRALRGKPQVFGLVMETELPGLVVDTLGINGARFGTLLAWQEEAHSLLVEQRHPALVVVAYGTNEVFDLEPVERHARRLEEVVLRLRRSAVDASCLVVGPTDAGKGGDSARSRVGAMDAAERSTAERNGCAYFSPFELMVSEGGFDGWARQEPPLALSDGIHLSARGYGRLGEALALLLRADN